MALRKKYRILVADSDLEFQRSVVKNITKYYC